MGNIGAVKFGVSTNGWRHADMLGANVVQRNKYKKGWVGDTRLSRFYLIK